MPAAALLLSPMTDLTVTGASYAGKAQADPAISARAIRTRAADYLAAAPDSGRPLVSPIFADLVRPAAAADPGRIARGPPRRRHPPGGESRSRRRGRHPGHHPGVPHVFQAFAALLDEGDAALDRAARFVKDNTARALDSC